MGTLVGMERLTVHCCDSLLARSRLQRAAYQTWRIVTRAARLANRRSTVVAARALAFWINFTVYR
jgi:hypothetical protein